MLREAEADADVREMGRENRVWSEEKDANGWLLSLGRIPEPENVERGRGCARADDRRRPATIAAVPRAADRIPCPILQNWRASAHINHLPPLLSLSAPSASLGALPTRSAMAASHAEQTGQGLPLRW